MVLEGLNFSFRVILVEYMVYNLYSFLILIKEVWALSTSTIIEPLKAATFF